jgi:hypothetical protein
VYGGAVLRGGRFEDMEVFASADPYVHIHPRAIHLNFHTSSRQQKKTVFAIKASHPSKKRRRHVAGY